MAIDQNKRVSVFAPFDRNCSTVPNKKIIFLFQKCGLNEVVLYSTQNICLKLWVSKYLQFYAEKIC